MTDDVEVRIGATTADLSSGMNDAKSIVSEGTRDMQASFESLSDTLKDVAKLFGVGLSAEFFKSVIEGATEAAEKTENMSQALGMSTQTLQTVGYAASLVGGNFDTASMAMARMERAATEAVTGNTKLAAAFHDIGISSAQLGQLLNDPNQMIQTVAQHFSEFANDGQKTAAVMQIFGRNAQQMVPLLQELGTNFAQLQQHAKDIGVVLSDEDQQALATAQRGFNDLGQQVKGLENQFTIALLPAINAVRSTLADLLSSGDAKAFMTGIANAVNDVIVLFGEVKKGFTLVRQAAADFFDMKPGHMAWDDIPGDLAHIADAWTNLKEIAIKAWILISEGVDTAFVNMEHGAAAFFNWMAEGVNKFTGVGWLADKLGLPSAVSGMKELTAGMAGAAVDVPKYTKAINDNWMAAEADKDAHAVWAQGVRDSAAALATQGSALDAVSQQHLHLTDVTNAAADAQAKIQEMLDSLAAKAEGPYDAAWSKYDATMDRFAGVLQGDVVKGFITAAQAADYFQQANTLAEQAAVKEIDTFYEQIDVLGALMDKYSAAAEAVGALTNYQKAEAEVDKALADELNNLTAKYGEDSDEVKAFRENVMSSRDATIASIAAFKDHQDAIKADQEALKEWETIATNAFDSAFSTINKDIVEGGNVMKDLVNVAKTVVEEILLQFEKLAIINPLLNQIFGQSTGTLLPTLLGGGQGGVLGNLGSLFSGNNSITSSAGNWLGGLFGAGAVDLGGAGVLTAAGATDIGLGGGSILGALDSSSVLAGTSGLAGGVAGSAGILGTIGTVLPWVGVGIAALGILDKLSGGNIFGGSKQPWGSEETLNVGDSGANISAMEQFKKKGALFSGNSYSWSNTAVDQQTQDAVAAYFTALQTAATQESALFGQSTADIVTGSFKETFDKNGKMMSQTSTVAGQQFTESMQDFESRLLSDTLLANLGDYTKDAQDIASKWQGSAQTLLTGTQFLVMAATDAQRGMSLLGSDTSLKDIDAVVEKLAVSGESLVQTYTRLQAETGDIKATLDELGLTTTKTGTDFVQFSDDMVKAAGGLQNLNTLWGDYYTNFFSDSERAAIKLKNDQQSLSTLGAAIGQDPNETMAQFRANFQAVFDTLTPEQIVQWLQFAEALNAVNKDMGATAQTTVQNAAALSDFMKQFSTSTGTDFENTINGLADSMNANIDKANSYGASLQDVGTIMEFSAEQGVKAFQQLEQQTQQLAASLYGTQVDQLQAQLDSFKGTDLYQFEKALLQPQIDAANQQAAAQKRLSDASTLLQDFGQIGAFTGEGLDAIAKQFGVPLDKFAKDLGLDMNGLKAAFAHQEDLANAAIESRDYLKDIRDLLEGKPITVLDKTTGSQTAIGGKNVGSGAVGGSMTDHYLAQIVGQNDRLISILGSAPPPNRRTLRGVVLTP
jgi:hypothetical protein